MKSIFTNKYYLKIAYLFSSVAWYALYWPNKLKIWIGQRGEKEGGGGGEREKSEINSLLKYSNLFQCFEISEIDISNLYRSLCIFSY